MSDQRLQFGVGPFSQQQGFGVQGQNLPHFPFDSDPFAAGDRGIHDKQSLPIPFPPDFDSFSPERKKAFVLQSADLNAQSPIPLQAGGTGPIRNSARLPGVSGALEGFFGQDFGSSGGGQASIQFGVETPQEAQARLRAGSRGQSGIGNFVDDLSATKIGFDKSAFDAGLSTRNFFFSGLDFFFQSEEDAEAHQARREREANALKGNAPPEEIGDGGFNLSGKDLLDIFGAQLPPTSGLVTETPIGQIDLSAFDKNLALPNVPGADFTAAGAALDEARPTQPDALLDEKSRKKFLRNQALKGLAEAALNIQPDASIGDVLLAIGAGSLFGRASGNDQLDALELDYQNEMSEFNQLKASFETDKAIAKHKEAEETADRVFQMQRFEFEREIQKASLLAPRLIGNIGQGMVAYQITDPSTGNITQMTVQSPSAYLRQASMVMGMAQQTQGAGIRGQKALLAPTARGNMFDYPNALLLEAGPTGWERVFGQDGVNQLLNEAAGEIAIFAQGVDADISTQLIVDRVYGRMTEFLLSGTPEARQALETLFQVVGFDDQKAIRELMQIKLEEQPQPPAGQ